MNQQNIIASDQSNGHSPIRVGLSACLAGQTVRYNGGHAQSRLCLNVLSEYFSFTTFCPEVAAGFGTPRPTMRLTGEPSSPRLTLSTDTDASTDLSTQLKQGFEHKLPEFANLDGYILMKNSPSCGLERVKVYQANGYPHSEKAMGIFARALQEAYPLMPIEEEGRLHDDQLFDNFILRVYAHHHFRQEVLSQPSLQKLIAFHARYKFVLLTHNQARYRYLGKLLGSDRNMPLTERVNTYFSHFMQALAKPANKHNHTNTLLHILGYLKKSVPSTARQQMVDIIFKYKEGLIPLSTPLTLLKHYLQQYGSPYINAQHYLNPYPERLHPISKYCR